MNESHADEKLKLIELVEFFYAHYKDQKLSWFDKVFAEFEKLRNETIIKP